MWESNVVMKRKDSNWVGIYLIRGKMQQHQTSVNILYLSARPNFGGVSGSADRGGGDNSIQFINFGRVGDKSFKGWG